MVCIESIGVGMDDAFVLLAAWRRTNTRMSVPERLGHTYAEAAVSITITSITNFISFLIGTITPFPSVLHKQFQKKFPHLIPKQLSRYRSEYSAYTQQSQLCSHTYITLHSSAPVWPSSVTQRSAICTDCCACRSCPSRSQVILSS